MAEGLRVLSGSVVGNLRRCRRHAGVIRSAFSRGIRTGSGGDERSVLTVVENGRSVDDPVYDRRSRATAPRVDDPARLRVDTTFENCKEAYMSKTNAELLRGYSVFQMCSIKLLVDKNKQLLKLGRKIFGKYLFERIMRATVYGQFVAGEDVARIRPLVQHNKSFGVKSILDYSVEKDISREEAREAEIKSCGDTEISASENEKLNKKFSAHYQFGDRRENVTSARTYFYEDEHVCDENVERFLDGIDTVSQTTDSTGFTAVKLTALGRPQLLLQLSAVLTAVRRYFEMLSSGYGTGTLTEADFERHLRSFNLDVEERRRWFTILDVSKDGEIDLLDWHNLLEVNVSLAKVLRLPNLKTKTLEPIVTELTELEDEQMKNMLRRIDTIVRYAKERDVRVMIDAEQTYFQSAINRLCMEMMRTYNRDKPYVFNTYQCYLKDAYNMVTTDLALARRENFCFGAKLVRGAYMDQERVRAATLGYEDPICRSYEATTKMYETNLEEVFAEMNRRPKGKVVVMVASHNEDTVRFTINKMPEYGIKSSDEVVFFGQLYGMCDQVSFSLGQAGYSVYKYVPYGPVEEVLPYLSRRVTENQGILAKVKKEKRLLRNELLRRFRSFNWWYTPPKGTCPSTSPKEPEPMKQAS